MQMIFSFLVYFKGRVTVHGLDTLCWVFGGSWEQVIGIIGMIWLKNGVPSES